jgi:crotonobetainyl-CoA:carnitine CoA-transferase CaiB-like acyl-CoA transferase
MTDPPLAGVRVLDLSSVVAGPACAGHLADLGADVIKVEHPKGGDALRAQGSRVRDVSLWFKGVNRNKRGLAIDLGAPDGPEVLRRLLPGTDVVVEAFRPGTLERWGLDPRQWLEQHPHLIVIRISGFGQTGPYAGRPGFGTLAEAMSGFALTNGTGGDPPLLPPFAFADSVAGMAAAFAAAAALYRRSVDGSGDIIDIDLVEPIVSVLGPSAALWQHTGQLPARCGSRTEHNAPRNVYRCADGSWVAISSSTQSTAERLLRLVGREDLVREPWFATGQQRAAHADELDHAIQQWIGERDRDTVLKECAHVGAAAGPVYSIADLVADEHFRERGTFIDVADPELSSMLLQSPLARFRDHPSAVTHAGPSLGQHTDEVLREAGFAQDEIDSLRGSGAVA